MKVHRPGVVLHLVKVFCEANLRRKLQGLGVHHLAKNLLGFLPITGRTLLRLLKNTKKSIRILLRDFT